MTEQGERLQKLLASLGLASRREAETWIRAGRVTLNGAVATLARESARGMRCGSTGDRFVVTLPHPALRLFSPIARRASRCSTPTNRVTSP